MLRPTLVLAIAVAVAAIAGSAAIANGATNAYGVAPTKSCLAKKGAVVGSDYGGADSILSGAERARLISATVTGPSFLYMAFGANVSQAKALRAKITRSLSLPPTAANSISGEAGNVAWVLVSALGTPPGANMRTFVTGCLKTGAVPTGATALTPTSLTQCLGSRSIGAPVNPTIRANGYVLPAALKKHVTIHYVVGKQYNRYGGYAYTAFGRTPAQAIAYRAALMVIIRAPFDRQWMGTKGNVAWLVAASAKASDTAAASAKQKYLTCLN